MSLVNQMLRDLEKRQGSVAGASFSGEVLAPQGPDSVPYGGRLMIALGLLVLMLIVAGLAAWFFTRPVATLTPASVSASAPVAALPPGVDATHVAAATDREPAAALAAGAGEPAMLAASSPSLHPSSPQSAAGHAVPSAPDSPVIAPAPQEVLPYTVKRSTPAVARETTRRLSSSGTDAIQLKLDELLTFGSGFVRPPAAASASAVAPSSGRPVEAAAAPKSLAEHAGEARTQGERAGKDDKAIRIEKIERSETQDDQYRVAVETLKQGHTEEGVAMLQSLLQANARNVAARQALAGAYVGQRRWDEALALLGQGLALMPEQATWAMSVARIQVERGQATEAWATLQKHAGHALQNAEYQGFAGVLLQHLKKPHEAVERYRAALRLRPREGRWWYALATALEEDGQAAEALEAYRRAQSLGGLTPAMNEDIAAKLQ
jgi:MSHA biogenesis protein MshN